MRIALLLAFIRLVDRISAAAAAAAIVFLAAMAAIMLAEIFVRYFFNSTLHFSWEFASYLMSSVFFLGSAYTLRTSGHIRMSIVSETVPERVRLALDIVCTLIGVAITSLIAAALVDLAWQSYLRGVTSATPTETLLAIPQAGPALGACLLCLQMVARLACLLIGRAPDLAPPGGDLEIEM
ncbi:MAG: TRAP transporter small permease subunit [Methyloceanibacter sp.]